MFCSINGCYNQVYKNCPNKGWCQKHYRCNYTHGDPLFKANFRISSNDIRDFIEKAIVYTKKGSCLIWPYNRNPAGYARAGKIGLVHRFICKEVYGKAPRGKPHALHDNGQGRGCGSDGCVNPHHLRWGSKQEDVNDKIKHGTQNKGETIGNHKLIEKEIIEIHKLYYTGKWTHQQIADRFQVSQTTITNIINRKIWKHIKAL